MPNIRKQRVASRDETRDYRPPFVPLTTAAPNDLRSNHRHCRYANRFTPVSGQPPRWGQLDTSETLSGHRDGNILFFNSSRAGGLTGVGWLPRCVGGHPSPGPVNVATPFLFDDTLPDLSTYLALCAELQNATDDLPHCLGTLGQRDRHIPKPLFQQHTLPPDFDPLFEIRPRDGCPHTNILNRRCNFIRT